MNSINMDQYLNNIKMEIFIIIIISILIFIYYLLNKLIKKRKIKH